MGPKDHKFEPTSRLGLLNFVDFKCFLLLKPIMLCVGPF